MPERFIKDKIKKRKYTRPGVELIKNADCKKIIEGLDGFTVNYADDNALVAKFGDHGHIIFRKLDSPEYGTGVFVTYATTYFTRAKIGTFMMEKMFEYLKSKEYKFIVLNSTYAALGFYKKLGFIHNNSKEDERSLIKFL